MKIKKIASVIYILFLLIILITRVAALLLPLYLRLITYPTVQAWKFKKACKKHVRGQNLKRLTSIYRSALADTVQAWKSTLFEQMRGRSTTSSQP